MDTVKRLKLQKMREKIVEDLNVEYILDHLISSGIINLEDKEKIIEEKSRKDKTRHLLDLLPRKGQKAYEVFVSSLEKDYDWLYNDLLEGDSEASLHDEGDYYDALLLGGLPRSPPHNVKREEKLAELRQCLKELKRGNYVVLHGMTGSGKSCLAAASIEDRDLVMDTFKGSVVWLSVGDTSSNDTFSHMVQLWHKLQTNTSLQQDNTEVESQLRNVSGAQKALIHCFLDIAHREGLLILDDVGSPDIIKAFDIGCKILVTTKDIEVMKSVKGQNHLIKISEGFTEHESLSLLAESVGTSVDQLPPQAKKIHRLSKGVPMIIALIGGQLEDNHHDALHSPGRWDYYVDMLARKDFGKIKRNSLSQQDGLLWTIGMSINNLSSQMKIYYRDFAVFIEDVNIKSEVLQTLWSLETRYEVEDIMSNFIKKSLAVSKWNEETVSCVYGIHDLLLCYLKVQLTEDEKIAMHKRLLDAYSTACKGNFANLPNDNYIFYYIGYHLFEAQMWPMFQKLFLDLEFIGAKLKVTGPGDLLVDYKKYGNYIINEDKKAGVVVADIKKFIKTYGLDLYKFQDLDIIQCGLQERSNSHVYKMALKIAKDSPRKLYLDFIIDQDIPSTSESQTVPLKEEVFAACFTEDKNKILIANGSGQIYLWELDYARMLYTFTGHKQRVVHLEMSPDPKQFLSCSEDGTVKLWSLEGVVCRNSNMEEFDELGLTLHVPSPRWVQTSWSNMFTEEDVPCDRSLVTFSCHNSHVHKATFSHCGKEVISCSKDGFIKVWNCETGEVRVDLTVPVAGSYASYCTFSSDDSLILFGEESTLYIFDNYTGDFVSSFRNSGSIITILTVPDWNNAVIVVTYSAFTLWKWEYVEERLQGQNGWGHHDRRRSKDRGIESLSKTMMETFGENKSANYVCATVSQDGSYLVAAASDHSISIWDTETTEIISEYKDHSGLVRCLDTFWMEHYQLLLSGSDDRTLKIWRLDQCGSDHTINLLASFDTAWDVTSLETKVPLLATPDSTNKLQVLRGKQKVAETAAESSKITLCALSSSGLLAVYGCKDGQVKQFDVKSKLCDVIMKLSGGVEYLELLQSRELVLVAAGDAKSLKMWTENGRVLACGGQTCRVVQSFLLTGNQLLSCSEDASVKLWDTRNGKLVQVVTGRLDKAHITSADMNTSKDVLVLGDANCCFHMAALQVTNDSPFLTLTRLTTIKVEDSVRSCQISPDAQLLALGQDCGDIILWDLENSKDVSKLKLHKSWVRCLKFASTIPGRSLINSTLPLLLVSVGEQVGWWDVSKLLAAARRRQRRSGSRRRGSSSPLPPRGDVHSLLTLPTNEGDASKDLSEAWFNKDGRKEKSELLGCIKLVGPYAHNISTSPDFSAFATIDTSGVVYLLKVLQ